MENLTQIKLAERLSITDRAISKWETGKAMPDSYFDCNFVRVKNRAKKGVNKRLLI